MFRLTRALRQAVAARDVTTTEVMIVAIEHELAERAQLLQAVVPYIESLHDLAPSWLKRIEALAATATTDGGGA